MKTYRIFPGIGIARVGNSKTDYYIGPEAPNVPADTGGLYRDPTQHIKRQGAKFRIYEFDTDNFGRTKLLREITADQAEIKWQVHFKNGKAAAPKFPPELNELRNAHISTNRSQLEISCIGTTQGKNTVGQDLTGKFKTDDVKLGNLHTDPLGRLVVLGGHGCSKSVPAGTPISNFANNSDWYDDVSDGPVTATIQFPNEAKPHVIKEPAWVVVASPAYAPEIRNLVTWYDQAQNVNSQHFNPGIAAKCPSFTHDIYPILERTVQLQWTSPMARQGHRGGRGNFLAHIDSLSQNDRRTARQRKDVFERLAEPMTTAPDPESLAGRPQNMPRLNSGVNPRDPNSYIFPTLTSLQFSRMKLWSEGHFDADWTGAPVPAVPFNQIPLQEQPEALNRAALEECIGGAFFPGIESGYVMAQAKTYESPFRIHRTLDAGYLTRGMALPWHADFLMCGRLWWPAQRPIEVKRGRRFQEFTPPGWDYSDMLEHWWTLGFVVRSGTQFVEREAVPRTSRQGRS